jgi:hypothetical protein
MNIDHIVRSLAMTMVNIGLAVTLNDPTMAHSPHKGSALFWETRDGKTLAPPGRLTCGVRF